MIGEPPLLAGAFQVTVTLPEPTAVVVMIGGDGTVAGTTVGAATAAELPSGDVVRTE